MHLRASLPKIDHRGELLLYLRVEPGKLVRPIFLDLGSARVDDSDLHDGISGIAALPHHAGRARLARAGIRHKGLELELEHFLIKGGNRHFAHDVVGLGLIGEIDNLPCPLVGEDGRGRWNLLYVALSARLC